MDQTLALAWTWSAEKGASSGKTPSRNAKSSFEGANPNAVQLNAAATAYQNDDCIIYYAGSGICERQNRTPRVQNWNSISSSKCTVLSAPWRNHCKSQCNIRLPKNWSWESRGWSIATLKLELGKQRSNSHLNRPRGLGATLNWSWETRGWASPSCVSHNGSYLTDLQFNSKDCRSFVENGRYPLPVGSLATSYPLVQV